MGWLFKLSSWLLPALNFFCKAFVFFFQVMMKGAWPLLFLTIAILVATGPLIPIVLGATVKMIGAIISLMGTGWRLDIASLVSSGPGATLSKVNQLVPLVEIFSFTVVYVTSQVLAVTIRWGWALWRLVATWRAIIAAR